MTPWTDIEQRIKGAAIGNFVIAIYNPRSKKRDWQLEAVRKILLEYRQGSTPVALAHQLGRKEEKINFYTLKDFPLNEVNMLTIVLFGNSHTSIQDNDWLLTERGY